MPTFQYLISTMHQNDKSLLGRLNITADAVVINQCDSESKEDFEYNGHCIKWINTTQRGLSRSRNMAIENATADICLLVDDDEVLFDDTPQIVLKSFIENPQFDIIGFQVKGIEREFKRYSPKAYKVGYLKSMKMASVEIAFRRESLRKKLIKFNELIGAGTKYMMGEENTMLFNALSAGLKIYYSPRDIAHLHIQDSTWFEGYNDRYFKARGAVFTAMSRRWSLPLIIQFALRKYRIYKSQMSMLRALKIMNEGRKEYLSILNPDA